jgi:hypothetical protein
MDKLDLRENMTERVAAERVAESVRRALKLVGPAEGGAERLWAEDLEEQAEEREERSVS